MAVSGTRGRCDRRDQCHDGTNIDPIEKNGFSIIDVTPEQITVRLFAWREPDSVESIDALEPFDVVEIRRNA